MPVPKSKQKIYGAIAGKMQNAGYDLEEAKDIADKAVKHKDVTDKVLRTTYKAKGKAQSTANNKKKKRSTALKDQKH